MRADRLLSLVLLLQSRGRLTAAQLAAQLEVSVRTIYRDVVALGTAGIPVHADPGGYRLVDGYRTQLTGLTAEEARGLVLAGLPRAAADLGLAGAVAVAQLKVDAALSDGLREQVYRMRQRFHLDAPGWYHDGDSSSHLARLADAVWRQRVIEVTYESWTRTVQRRLSPYGLVLKSGRWYLVAAGGAGVLTFRVSSIRDLTVLAEAFTWPDGFDLATYWAQHVADFRARLHRGEALIRLAPGALQQLGHLMGPAVASAAAAGVERDGWIEAAVPIESEEHAERELLRLGAQVEVLEPASLRARLAATVDALAGLYDAGLLADHRRWPNGGAAGRRQGCPAEVDHPS